MAHDLTQAGSVRRWCFVLAIALAGLVATPAEARFVPAPGSPYSAGDEPYSVSPGRFDADPLQDLAVVNGTSSNVDVFLQRPGNAGFAAAAGSPFAVGSGPSFGAVADFNADGRQDIAVANYVGETVSVMLQQPNGALVQEGAAIAIGDQASAIAAADFNNDGRTDFAVATWNNHTIRLGLRNGANTGFTLSGGYDTGGTTPRFIAAGDLDGANGPDLAVTNAGSDTIAVLLGQPGGTLQTQAASPYPAGDSPQHVLIAPLDGDGLPDIAAPNNGSGNVTILRRKAAGGFEPAAGSPVAVGSSPVGIAAADFRRVGRNDLAVALSGQNAVGILQNDGGTFTRGEDIPVAAAPFGLATGRFNDGDSLPDLAVANVAGVANDPLDVLLNFHPPRATTGEATAVTATTATLNATVNPAGAPTDAHFEYGPTGTYGLRAPAGGELDAGSDEADHAVSRAISGLVPNTTYHYRVVTSNAGGTTAGADRTFRTPAAAATPPATQPDGAAPEAFLTAPSEVAVGTPTTLSAEGSTPVNGLTYRLDLDGSGRFATDLKTERSLQTTFTTPGDVRVALRVTDEAGRTDEVRRTVRVVPPPLYAVSISPDNPKPGQQVEFKVREAEEGASLGASAVRRPLSSGSLATMSFGDGRTPDSVVGGLLVRDRAASSAGNFAHTFDRAGTFRVHLAVDDLIGSRQAADIFVRVGQSTAYAPAIATDSTSVEQGSCVGFTNATASRLAVNSVGKVLKEDINPVNRIMLVKPTLDDLFLGGQPKFEEQILSANTLLRTKVSSPVVAGSPIAHLAFRGIADLNLTQVAANFRAVRARAAQAEPTVTTDGTKACQMQAEIERATATAVANFDKPPYPKGADAGWPALPECPGGHKSVSYSTDYSNVNGLTRDSVTTRHAFFSINEWDFGDGARSGADAYLPSYKVFHPYDKAGTFNVKLTTTSPKDLGGQLAQWTSSCRSTPMNATRPDGRFEKRTVETKLKVRARYSRIRSRGLWMTSGANYFTESDLPGVYQSTGPIYINTRRVGYGWNEDRSRYDENADVGFAGGVLVVTPVDRPLQVVPDQGEIIGAANIAWQGGRREQMRLGGMPLKIRGVPGLVIPPAANGVHDFGVFNDPPASLVDGPVPARGKPFHINSAHVALRADNGGRLDLNVHMPAPLGPNGGESDETISRDVNASGRAASANGRYGPRAFLDDFDLTLPKIVLVPDIVEFNGGKLSHDVKATPPWQATGSLNILGKKVDMSPDSQKPGCPVVGGLGFYADGGLEKAAAVIDGLKIPIPNPPAPPVTALVDPGLSIMPGTSTRPLDLFGCLALTDYPAGKAFRVTGCAGLLLAGGGVAVPVGEKIPFCPNERGEGTYQLTEHNSVPGPNGRRIMRGIVVRVSGEVGLGPKAYPVANAYIEFRDSPFAVEFQGRFGQEFLGGAVKIGADLFGYFRGTDDWAIGGGGGLTQSLICLPNPFGDALCPSANVAALVSNKGIGGCVTILAVGIGAVVRFDGPSFDVLFPGCDLEGLKEDLGVSLRATPRAVGLLRRPGDPVAIFSQVQSGKVTLDGDAPYTLLVVKGAGRSPLVQVRDPDGKRVLDDDGRPVQGISQQQPRATPKGEELPDYEPPKAPQGIIHNDGSTYVDGKVDLRNTTLVMVRAPKQGAYSVTAKPGSAPITAISHADALGQPKLSAGVVRSRSGKRMLSLQSKVPVGTTVTISEESNALNRKITTLSNARSSGVDARMAQTTRQIRFTPAEGTAGMRRIVATLSRNGIPQHRMVIGRYRAPGVAKAGAIRGLQARAKGSQLTVSWKKARAARRYRIVIGLGKGRTQTRWVSAKRPRLVLREALVRQGATVTVRAVGGLSIEGKPATRRVAAQKVRKPKRFVL